MVGFADSAQPIHGYTMSLLPASKAQLSGRCGQISLVSYSVLIILQGLSDMSIPVRHHAANLHADTYED